MTSNSTEKVRAWLWELSGLTLFGLFLVFILGLGNVEVAPQFATLSVA